MLVTINEGRARAWDSSPEGAFGEQVGDGGIHQGDAISRDGRLVAAKSGDTAMIRNRRSGEDVWLAEAESTGPLEFSADGTAIAGQGDGYAMVWDTASGELEHVVEHTPDPHVAGSNQSLALSPDGELLVTTKNYPDEAGDDFAVQAWRIADGELVESLHPRFIYETTDVAFSPDGELLAATGFGRGSRSTIQLWETDDWTTVARRSLGGSQEINGFVFSPDGLTLATAEDPGPVRLWSVPELEPRGRPLFADVDVVPAIAFSPDGTILATGGEDGKIRLWDLESQEMLGKSLPGHSQYVDTLRFSADGRELVSIGDEGLFRTWDSVFWAGDFSRLHDFVCGAIGHNLSRADWGNLVPEEPYHPTCS
jgi:WD40 repeat protein